ncbi:MAG: hypothetical protein KAW12_12170, partial [Candidatus Aminicenantes bacterium]|nr:hypothetical protein [Candidatus Aminicenantes bacterium]
FFKKRIADGNYSVLGKLSLSALQALNKTGMDYLRTDLFKTEHLQKKLLLFTDFFYRIVF